ncbi:MAG: 16S rRNA (adenine(1518)-N(6)/adenine(1519)-N(6))-dimethyltransferase RsmA [Phycisphaeraceae bacterium]
MTNPQRPSIRQQLSAAGLFPKKALGQNFLVDPNHLRRIVAAANLDPSDTVLEIGPGTGVLTAELINTGARVIAVEIDRDMQQLLRERFGDDTDRFQLILADALDGKHGLNQQLTTALADHPFKMVANLPYQAASPLLINLAAQMPAMTHAVALIQKEVADRILAGPGSKTYGILGILLQVSFKADLIGKVPPGCFYPPPKVDSAVIRLTRSQHPELPLEHLETFAAFLHEVFGHRRKQLGSLLGRDRPWPQGISPTDRPEQVDINGLIALYKVGLDPSTQPD